LCQRRGLLLRNSAPCRGRRGSHRARWFFRCDGRCGSQVEHQKCIRENVPVRVGRNAIDSVLKQPDIETGCDMAVERLDEVVGHRQVRASEGVGDAGPDLQRIERGVIPNASITRIIWRKCLV